MLTPEEADAIAAEYKRSSREPRPGRWAMTREQYLRLDPQRPVTNALEDRRMARGQIIVPDPPPSGRDLLRRQWAIHQRRATERRKAKQASEQDGAS